MTATSPAATTPPRGDVPVVTWQRTEDRRLVLLGCASLLLLGFILAAGGTISLPVGGAVSLLWPAVAVQFVAALWFGWPGVLVGVLFPIFSNLLVADAATALLFTPANAVQSATPLVLFRLLHRDPRLARPKDVLTLLLAAVLASSSAGTLGGVGLALRGASALEAFRLGATWAATNSVLAFVLGFPLLRCITPVLREVRDITRTSKRPAFGMHLIGAAFTIATAAVAAVVALHVLHRKGFGLPLESVPGILAVLLLPGVALAVYVLWKLLAVPLEGILRDSLAAANSGAFPAAAPGDVAEFAFLRTRLADLLATVREREQRFAGLFAAVGEPVMLVDTHGKLVDANPAFARVFGVSVEKARGRNLVAFNDASSRPALRQFLAEKPANRMLSLRTRARTAQGLRQLQLTATPWRVPGGALLGYCVVATDLTEQEERERRAEAAARFAGLAQLTASLAHEINNLLQVAQNTLALWPEESPETAERLTSLRKVLARLGQLVHRLQLVSQRPHRVPAQVFAASELLVGAERVAREANVAIRVENLNPDVEVFGHRGLLVEAVEALVRNAVEASAPGHEVVVRLRQETQGRGAHGGKGVSLVVEVEDRGEGIAAEDEQRVFEPFFSSKDRSRHLGLGLTLAKQAVEHAGGQLTLHRKPEGGTLARMSLPVAGEKADKEPASASQLSGATPGRRVLVVDDDPELLKSLQQLLAALDYDVVTASGGQQALELLAACGETLDAVILDLLMPEVSGFEVLEVLRKRFPKLPVVLSTGYAPDDKVRQALVSGPTAFLQKPYTLGQLEETLARLMAGQQRA
ncbi:Sensor kinase CckA [bacterium HR09]|nr:Sensor kinase CckA [bacterium HR09]